MAQRGSVGTMHQWVAQPPSATKRSSSLSMKISWQHVAPFLSVTIIAVSLFFVAFAKMEVRRLGYSVWKLSREERRVRDFERDLQIQLAKATRPERLADVAVSRLTLRQATKGQIIQMTESGVALEQ